MKDITFDKLFLHFRAVCCKMKMFRATAENVSLETLQNCKNEALHLYTDIAGLDKRPDAKMIVWHGAKERRA